jgi:hypothetical protein
MNPQGHRSDNHTGDGKQGNQILHGNIVASAAKRSVGS